jgi:hyperosmotically inducible periplasmic protein
VRHSHECILVLTLMLVAPVFINAQPGAESTDRGVSVQAESQIQTDIAKVFNKDRFKQIQATVNGGIVNLTGKADLFSDKEDADRKVRHIKNVIAVRNQIEAGGVSVPDNDLQEKLVKKLEYDRVGYGTTAFNAISVGVSDGVVTLGGHAYGPTDKASALSVVSYCPGVRDVVDEIEVDPVSSMDDRIRIETARAMYGSSALSKYAIDPGKPIRISVQHGNVTLYGVVNSKADRDIAFMRANGVPGVFKVTNQLQVEGESQIRE